MSRRDGQRLQDILDAIDAIRSHLARGELSGGLVFDAVRVRLIEIGEAIKGISPELLDPEPGHPWTDIARMRDRLAPRYLLAVGAQPLPTTARLHQTCGLAGSARLLIAAFSAAAAASQSVIARVYCLLIASDSD